MSGTMNAATLPPQAYPGLTLGLTSSLAAGPGTHIHDGRIIASLSGKPTLTAPSRTSSTSTSTNTRSQLPTVSVSRSQAPTTHQTPASVSSQSSSQTTLPSLGSIVIGPVTRVQRDRVTLRIQLVDGQVVAASSAEGAWHAGAAMTGVVRREDVRGWEVDRVVCADQFRVGDVVRAVVISLGDQAAYYCSTARNELGVLMARAQGGGGGGAGELMDEEGGAEMVDGQGEWMVPVSWKEFMDTRTGRREGRKVAKPV